MALATMATCEYYWAPTSSIHLAASRDIYVSQLLSVNPLFHRSYNIIRHLYHLSDSPSSKLLVALGHYIAEHSDPRLCYDVIDHIVTAHKSSFDYGVDEI